VDLVGFEPTTSSMPFKKYQSLTDQFLVSSITYREAIWTPFGRHDLFHEWSGLRRDSGLAHYVRRCAAALLGQEFRFEA